MRRDDRKGRAAGPVPHTKKTPKLLIDFRACATLSAEHLGGQWADHLLKSWVERADKKRANKIGT